MAVLLPSLAFVKVLGTSESVQAGSIDLPQHIELAYLRVLLYKHGMLGGTEQVRAKLYTDSSYTQLYATSAWSSVSDITGLSTYWWGWLRLDFGRQNVSKVGVYYVALETQSYTESDTSYLSVSLDWPVPQNIAGDAPSRALMMQVYGYRSL
jgi:hypothetical protein